MRLALLSDIHANIRALEAVLDALRKSEAPDRIVCLGDAVNIGPRPHETVSLLKTERGLVCVHGNHELYLLCPFRAARLGEGERRHHDWTRAQLSADDLSFLGDWPRTLRESIEGNEFLFTHFAWDREADDYLSRAPRPQTRKALEDAFSERTAQTIVFGHIHEPFWGPGRVSFLNPGSVGCPGRTSEASYAIVDVGDRSGFSVRHARVTYDRDSVVADLRDREVPDGETISRLFFGESQLHGTARRHHASGSE